MESSSAILWDLVDRHDVTLGFFAGPEPNRRSFNQVRGLPRNTHRWHTICSLIGHLQDWLPGVAGSEPRLGCRFWGVNYEKGACTGPLFHFYRSPVVFGPGSCLTSPKATPRWACDGRGSYAGINQTVLKPKVQPSTEPYRPQLPPLCLRTVNCGLCTKKMSGRWGHRPLGRGDGGNSNPEVSLVFLAVLLPSRAAGRHTGADR